MVPVPEDQLPVLLPDIEDYAPKGQLAAGGERGVRRTRPARSAAAPRGARPTRWTPSSTPPGTSCATATRTTTSAPWDRASRRLLDAGRPVHRRRRARDPAPDVRALLHEGAGGHGLPRLPGAVREAVHPGDDHHQGAKMSKSKGNVISPSRLRRALRRGHGALLHPFLGPPEKDADWSDEGVERRPPLPEPRLAAGRRAARGRAARLGSQPEGADSRSCASARDDREGDPRHPGASTSTRRSRRSWSSSTRSTGSATRTSAGTVIRDGDRCIAAVPVRAAPQRRGLRARDGQAGVGGAVAAGGRGVPRARHGQARGPGERQGPRQHRGRRPARRRTRSSAPALERPTSSATSTASRWCGRSWCPGGS